MLSIDIKVKNIEKGYVVALTTAPKEYDGFGTIEIGEMEGKRLVLIDGQYFDWQQSRNCSGNHATVIEHDDLNELLEKEIVAGIWGRIQSLRMER